MGISLRRIETFVMVAEHRNVSAAARTLNLSQPAVTKSVRELERHYGVELVHRTSDGVDLTQYGERFYRRAKLILSELQHAQDEIVSLLGGRGSVSVGLLPNADYSLVSHGLSHYLRQHPDLRVVVREGTLDDLLRSVETGDMDFFVGSALVTRSSENLVSEVLLQDRLVIVCRPDHPLVGRPDLTFADLEGNGWVLPPRATKIHQAFDEAFQEAGLSPPKTWIEINTLAVLRSILCETDRLAIVAFSRIGVELQYGLLNVLPLNFCSDPFPIAVVRPEEGRLSPWARGFLRSLRQSAVEIKVDEAAYSGSTTA